MRIRTIKPEFWMHEGLCKQSDFTRLLAIALLNWADDEGYFLANPILIRGQVFPFLEDSKIIPRSLQDLSSVGWIDLGKDNQGREVGRIINFLKHQRVDKPQSSKIKPSSAFQEHSKNNPGAFQDGSKGEWNGMEEEKEEEGSHPLTPKGGTPSQGNLSNLNPPAETQKKKGATALVYPDGLSQVRREALERWVAYKAEKHKSYKPLGFAALLTKLAKLTDPQVVELVQLSMENNWEGLFPERVAQDSGGPSGYRKREGAVPIQESIPAVIVIDDGPEGWEDAWDSLYTFAHPQHWRDVPPANKDEMIQWMRRNAA